METLKWLQEHDIPKHVELAILKAEYAQEDDPTELILEALEYKALQLGADGIVIIKNDFNVGLGRNKTKPGIFTVEIREIEVKAIKFE